MIAKDIKILLKSSGIETPIFIGAVPEEPDTVVSLFITGGYTPSIKEIEEPTYQVRVRDPHLKKGYDLASSIKDIIIKTSHFQVKDRNYIEFFQTSDITQLGKDRNGRSELTINFRTYRANKEEYKFAELLVDIVEDTKNKEVYFIADNYITINNVKDLKLREKMDNLRDKVTDGASDNITFLLIDLAEESLSKIVLNNLESYLVNNDIIGFEEDVERIRGLVEKKEEEEEKRERELIDKIASKSRQIELLTISIESLENELKVKEKELNARLIQITELEELREQLEIELGKAERDKEKIQKQLDDVLASIGDNAKVIDQLIRDIEIKDKKIEELMNEMDILISILSSSEFYEFNIESQSIGGALSSIDIPEKIIRDGIAYDVKSIDSGAFEGFSGKTHGKITIPDTIGTIGDRAFYGVKARDLELGKNVRKIGNEAFRDSSIKNLKLGDSVEELGEYSFYNNGMNTLELSNNLKRIEKLTFFRNNLTELVLNGSLEYIGSQAFQQNNLSRIIFNNKLREIGSSAFTENDNLSYIKFNDELEKIGNWAFNRNNLIEVVFGRNLRVIGDSAFRDNNLDKLILNDNLEVVGNSGFYRAGKFNTLRIPEKVRSIGERSFQSCGIENLTIDGVIELIPENAFNGNFLKYIKLNKNLKTVERFGLGSASRDVEKIIIPSRVSFEARSGINGDFVSYYGSKDRMAGTYELINGSWERTGDYPE